jgi:hypothetical protein
LCWIVSVHRIGVSPPPIFCSSLSNCEQFGNLSFLLTPLKPTGNFTRKHLQPLRLKSATGSAETPTTDRHACRSFVPWIHMSSTQRMPSFASSRSTEARFLTRQGPTCQNRD